MEKYQQAFKIVVAAEQFGAVMQAQALARRLAAELKPALEIHSAAWKFEALGDLQVGKAAAEGAARADMVIIAAHGAVEPPDHVRSWIESWLPRKRKGATALVALVDYDDETLHESSPLCAYLRRLAGKWNVDFFSNSTNRRQQPPESTVEAPHHPRECRPFEMMRNPRADHAWTDCALND